MANDNTVTKLLDDIATKLEDLTGIAPDESILLDISIVARLVRIREAIEAGVFESHALGTHLDVEIDSPVPPEYLCYDGTNWVNALIALPHLSDVVDSLAPTNTDEVLRWQGTEWDAQVLMLANLGDVKDTLPAINENILIYDAALGKWTNQENRVIFATDTFFLGGTGILIGLSGTGGIEESTTELGDLVLLASNTLVNLNDTTITTPSDDEFLRYDGAAWINEAVSLVDTLDDLSDVTIAGPVDDEFLRYDGANWVNEAVSLVGALDDLSDVVISGPADDEFLRYDGANWINEAVVFSTDLDGLTDVTITAAADREILQNDGAGQWVDRDFATAGLIDRDGTIPLTGDWDAGDFEITAQKLIVNETGFAASYDTILAQINQSTNIFINGPIWRNLFVDLDLDVNADFNIGVYRGIDIDVDIIESGTGTSLATITPFYLRYDVDANSGITTKVIDCDATFAGNIGAFSSGAYLFKVTAANTANVVGLRAQVINTVAASAGASNIAYQGYYDGDNVFTGEAIALSAFCANVSTTARTIGVLSQPIALGTSPGADKTIGFKSQKGHILIDQGSLFARSTATTDLSSFASTHLTHTANNGDGYFEGDLEVDGTTFMDGDLNHGGTNAGFYGTTPVSQASVLTAALTTITHTGPGTPDYAIATPVDSDVAATWGFSTQDEFETAMSVIRNLQVRVGELEAALDAATGVGLLA
jgi:hypothetical protein